MREDAWLAARLGTPCFTLEPADGPPAPAPGFFQAKVDCGDVARVAALEAAGFRVVDVNVTLRRDDGPLPVAGEWDVGQAREGDRDGVLEIAERDYEVSRFHLDPAIPDASARAIKRDWAAAALDGERGDGMLVARRDGEVAGFLAIAGTEAAKVVDLIAVARSHRSGGAGTALVAALVNESGAPVEAGTQASNTRAIAFYEALGFRTAASRYVLHRHGA